MVAFTIPIHLEVFQIGRHAIGGKQFEKKLPFRCLWGNAGFEYVGQSIVVGVESAAEDAQRRELSRVVGPEPMIEMSWVGDQDIEFTGFCYALFQKKNA